jgi:hypothetical protein
VKVVKFFICLWLVATVGQVARGDFIVFFNDIFDALCKLSADSDPNVQSAAHLLDRLVKVATLPLLVNVMSSCFCRLGYC